LLFFFNQLSALVERHAPDPDDNTEPSDEEIEAGCEWFADRFGALLGLDSAAGGSVLDYPRVLDTDADTVLRKLQMEGARAAYQRRYQQLVSPKKD
jgi:hypothetical protein